MAMSAVSVNTPKMHYEKISVARMVILHLLPGALAMLLMLLAGALFERAGIFPSVPVIFVFVAPVLALGQLAFLYYKGKQLNGKLSLQGVVLYREEPMPWWKIIGLALPIFAWIALVWFVFKPPLNNYFITNFFSWMPAYFFDEYFLNNLSQYMPSTLIVLGIFFTLSIALGGAVEELYFRGYLLPRK